jgi:hypothetical protein
MAHADFLLDAVEKPGPGHDSPPCDSSFLAVGIETIPSLVRHQQAPQEGIRQPARQIADRATGKPGTPLKSKAARSAPPFISISGPVSRTALCATKTPSDRALRVDRRTAEFRRLAFPRKFSSNLL